MTLTVPEHWVIELPAWLTKNCLERVSEPPVNSGNHLKDRMLRFWLDCIKYYFNCSHCRKTLLFINTIFTGNSINFLINCV